MSEELVRYDAMCSAARDTGFVYLIEQVMHPWVVKIGWARNPPERIRRLRTGSAEQIALSSLIPGSRRDEAALHAMFRERRTRGEWFDDHDGQIRQYMRYRELLWAH